jgi:hypothetical protein
MIGQRFERLVIIDAAEKKKGSGPIWKCVCDCGKVIETRYYRLLDGSTKSCGCYAKDATVSRSTTHGKYNNGSYKSWKAMKARCLNPNAAGYARYGGAGVVVCDRWLKFENFYADMGERPDGCSLDRIDGTKGYEPGNCRWSTTKEQNLNRKSNLTEETLQITFEMLAQGKSHAQIANYFKISPSSITERIKTYRSHYINSDRTAAVATDMCWLSIDTCPLGVRVLGLSKGLVARVDIVTGKNTDLIGWAPLPRVPQWMKEASEA